mgnify:CR=1 FL=1
MRMDTVKKKLGYTVRSERERLGLSQVSLAERAGVPHEQSLILKPAMEIQNLLL